MKIGLTLGGGVVRGFAHVGMLMALEEAGIRPDIVTGTSVGSIVGAFVAAGWDTQSIREITKHLNWRGMARPAAPWRGGWISFFKLEQFVEEQLNHAQFSDLKLPFAAVATDLIGGNPIALTEGSVARAVHASSAVPGAVVPVEIGGLVLSDGGVSDNLPVRTTRAMGADYVIACNILGRYWSKARNPLTRGVAAIENAIRWAGGGLLLADCLIEPDISDVAYQSFKRGQYMIDQGRAAAEARIPEILQAIATGREPPTDVQQAVTEELEKAQQAAEEVTGISLPHSARAAR
jgi:NTE family protein